MSHGSGTTRCGTEAACPPSPHPHGHAELGYNMSNTSDVAYVLDMLYGCRMAAARRAA